MPEEKEKMSADWFRDLRFGVFVHWGLYSIAGKGEWQMMVERWSPEEYSDAFLDKFDPAKDCVKGWVAAAKSAGAEYMVFTTRHHDGFSLFDSRASIGGFTSMNSPAKHDFVADFTHQVRAAGMKVGLYYSLADWRIHTHSKGELVDSNMNALRKQAREQIRELLTNYGKIDILWYDGPFGYDEKGILWGKEWPTWHPEELNAMVRELQPGIAINNRSGTPEDFGTPEQHITPENNGRMWEACMTMNDSWGYHRWDDHWKSPADLINNIITCGTRGGSYLLNIGPRGDGSVPRESLERLAAIGEWRRVYGGALSNGCELVGVGGYPMVRCDGTLFIFQRNWPGSTLRVTHVPWKLSRAWLVKSGKPVGLRQVDDLVCFSDMPEEPEDPYCTVVAAQIDQSGSRPA